MSRYDDDMARGCLDTGESLEALYGAGPWSDYGLEREAERPQIIQCHICGGNAYDLGDELAGFFEIENNNKGYSKKSMLESYGRNIDGSKIDRKLLENSKLVETRKE